MKPTSHLALKKLFGGAITLNIPIQWRDVSLVRQVPDHQECYQDCTDLNENDTEFQGTGSCLIVEILSRESEVRDEDASLFFFRDLAEVNGGLVQVEYEAVWAVGGEGDPSKEVTSNGGVIMPKLTKQITACSCIGIQSIDPLDNRNELESGKADKVRVELCILRLETEETDLLISLSMPLFTSNGQNSMHHSKLFLDILRGFQIVDWNIFG
jgi:Ran-interacting Mog1 protein.